MMRFIILTHPGLESFVIDELNDFSSQLIHPGAVVVSGDIPIERLLAVRSALYIKTFIGTISFVRSDPDFSLLVKNLCSYDYSFVDKPFRMMVKRHFTGNLPFKTVEVERSLVGHIEENYGSPFSLKEYEINLRVDLYPDNAHIGMALHKKDLSKRFTRPYNFSNAIKCNIAYAMCAMGNMGLIDNENVVDAFCGSATLSLEAIAFNSNNHFIAIDRNDHAVIGAKSNLNSNFAGHNWEVIQGDILKLSSLVSEAALILADPPFGRHMGKRLKFSRFFGYLLSEVRKILKIDGLFVIRVMKKDSFLKVADAIKGLVIERVVEVDQGGFSSYLISLRKTDGGSRT